MPAYSIIVCEAVAVNALQGSMTVQTEQYVSMQAADNAGMVNEWLEEQGNIIHTVRNAVAYIFAG